MLRWRAIPREGVQSGREAMGRGGFLTPCPSLACTSWPLQAGRFVPSVLGSFPKLSPVILPPLCSAVSL